MRPRALAFAAPGIALLALGACAPLPEDIKPVAVSAAPYEAENCQQLAAQHEKLADELLLEAAKETADRDKDGMAVFVIGLPLQSWLAGNEAKQIAALKGQQAAVAEAEARIPCARTPDTVADR